jgi:hypothetical protein
MKFTINNNEFYLNDVKLDKLISYSIEADNDRTKLTIELIVDDVEIETRRKENMEMNYEKAIENIIGSLVNEALLNSETYNEAKLYISKRVSHNELGLMIKKIAHDKIEYLVMNSKING